MVQEDYRKILGVPMNASLKEIRGAYLKRVKILHPDRFDQVTQKTEWQVANRMLEELNAAYSELLRTMRRVQPPPIPVGANTPSAQVTKPVQEPASRKTPSVFVRSALIVLVIVWLIIWPCLTRLLSDRLNNASLPASSPNQLHHLAIDQPSFSQLPISLPTDNNITRYTGDEGVAPLTISTPLSSTDNYYIKLFDPLNGKIIITLVIPAKGSVHLLVPLGTFKIKCGIGNVWYGDKYLFGPDTRFVELNNSFTFTQAVDAYNGYTISLILVKTGNLTQKDISLEGWDDDVENGNTVR